MSGSHPVPFSRFVAPFLLGVEELAVVSKKKALEAVTQKGLHEKQMVDEFPWLADWFDEVVAAEAMRGAKSTKEKRHA